MCSVVPCWFGLWSRSQGVVRFCDELVRAAATGLCTWPSRPYSGKSNFPSKLRACSLVAEGGAQGRNVGKPRPAEPNPPKSDFRTLPLDTVQKITVCIEYASRALIVASWYSTK